MPRCDDQRSNTAPVTPFAHGENDKGLSFQSGPDKLSPEEGIGLAKSVAHYSRQVLSSEYLNIKKCDKKRNKTAQTVTHYQSYP